MTAPTLHRQFINWEKLHRDARALAAKLRDAGAWQGIVAVTRGGVVPAILIARELGIAAFDTAIVAGYKLGGGDHAAQDEPRIVKPPAGAGDGAGWLVIDDLTATGRTLTVLRRLLPKAHFAAVYVKPIGKASVDSFLTEVAQDAWIYMPWYSEMHFTHPPATQHKDDKDE